VLALQAAHDSAPSGTCRRTGRLIAAASAAAAVAGDPQSLATVTLARGMREHLTGRFRAAADLLGVAGQQLRESCTGVTWELDTARAWWLYALCYLGDLAEVRRQWPALMADALDRGDLYAAVNLGTDTMAYLRIADDEPDRAWAELRQTMAGWTQTGFHVQHHSELLATALLHQYQCDGRAAWEYVLGMESSYHRSLLWQVEHIRIDYLQHRGRSAVLAAVHGRDQGRMIRAAVADARRLERESAGWGRALGRLLRASVAAVTERRADPDPFAAAAETLESVDLGLFAAAARYRQGERTDVEEGRRLRDEAVAWLTGQGVHNPLRMIRAHAPAPDCDSR
jgi:hypothetical protein